MREPTHALLSLGTSTCPLPSQRPLDAGSAIHEGDAHRMDTLHHIASGTRLVLGSAALAALLLASGCGNARIGGDPGGIPVTFHVTISRQFVRDLTHRRPGESTVYAYPSFAFGAYGYYGRRYPYGSYYDPFWGPPVGYGPPSTTAMLLGGDGPAQGRLFRVELDWGDDNTFTVPIAPGHFVTLTVQGYGGVDGWEIVGAFTAGGQPGQSVTLDLLEHAPKMTLVGAVPAPLPEIPGPPPPATAPPAPANPPPPPPAAPSVPPAAAPATAPSRP